jgi:hypothetical protein
MADKIKIRAGTGLQTTLQSTVNYAQAFTELAKNSLQNGATYCDIDIVNAETETYIKVTDDGRGFDHVRDEEYNLNDFEKYFTFGTSFDLDKHGDGPKLGKMGIGGKVSNDKLSIAGESHWQIHTKNIHGNCFVVDFNPPTGANFFDDYQPRCVEVKPEDSLIKTKTGTEVRILNVNKEFLNTDYEASVKAELLQFFAHLIVSYKKNNKMLDIIFMGNKLDFDIDLNGNYRGKITRTFSYEIAGETKHSTFEIALNEFRGRIRRQKNSSIVKELELISEVKVCDIHLNNEEIIENILLKLSKEENTDIDDTDFMGRMHGFIGYVRCDDLSRIEDDRGMIAKNISHHGLNDEHPMVKPFLTELYYVVMKLLYNISALNVRKSTRTVMNKNLIAYNVAKLLANDFSNDMEILTDKKMLGLDTVQKIDNAVQRDDLVLEKLLGNTYTPTDKPNKESTDKPNKESTDKPNKESTDKPNKESTDKPNKESTDKPNKESTENETENLHTIKLDEKNDKVEDSDTAPNSVTINDEEVAKEHKQSESSPAPAPAPTPKTSMVGSIVDSIKKRFNEESGDNSEEPTEYTQMTLPEYRKMLLKRSGLRIDIEELKDEITSGNKTVKNTNKLNELELELHTIENVISGIKLFYAIDYIDNPMVISTIREYRDGFIIVVNENNVRYRSIQSDIMSLALHVAEAMIKEIIYIEDKTIDKDRLDSELSKFYERHYKQLLGNDLLSM